MRLYFDAITTSIPIALSRSHLEMRPVISATLPNWLLCSCNVVSKHYAPDKNQAIRRVISCHTLRLISLNFMTSYYPFATVVGTSANKLVGSTYRNSCLTSLGYLACVIDIIGNQPILCQRRT